MKLFQIKNRFTFDVMFEVEAASLGDAVRKVIEANPSANLRGANLREANLSEANLCDANLSEADLYKANLSEADLSHANLSEADLSHANLSDANLGSVNLHKANLIEANLNRANLRLANLGAADLHKANLSEADLTGANLNEVHLWNCIGNMEQVKSSQLSKYTFAWTSEYLQIGCKRFKISEWFELDDATISKMDEGALDWWLDNKEYIRALVTKYPAL